MASSCCFLNQPVLTCCPLFADYARRSFGTYFLSERTLAGSWQPAQVMASGCYHRIVYKLPSLPPQESDEKWDQARSLTAQAQEQSRIAQTKSATASATERESNEAMRRADVARGNIQDLEVNNHRSLFACIVLHWCLGPEALWHYVD